MSSTRESRSQSVLCCLQDVAIHAFDTVGNSILSVRIVCPPSKREVPEALEGIPAVPMAPVASGPANLRIGTQGPKATSACASNCLV